MKWHIDFTALPDLELSLLDQDLKEITWFKYERKKIVPPEFIISIDEIRPAQALTQQQSGPGKTLKLTLPLDSIYNL